MRASISVSLASCAALAGSAASWAGGRAASVDQGSFSLGGRLPLSSPRRAFAFDGVGEVVVMEGPAESGQRKKRSLDSGRCPGTLPRQLYVALKWGQTPLQASPLVRAVVA